jgi:hypothetical protein
MRLADNFADALKAPPFAIASLVVLPTATSLLHRHPHCNLNAFSSLDRRASLAGLSYVLFRSSSRACPSLRLARINLAFLLALEQELWHQHTVRARSR